MKTLFEGLREMGFMRVSREVNLQPLINPKVGLPLAAEFTFVNPDLFYRQGQGGQDWDQDQEKSQRQGSSDVLSSSSSSSSSSTSSITRNSFSKSSRSLKSHVSTVVEKEKDTAGDARSEIDNDQASGVIYILTQRSRVTMLSTALQLLYSHFYADLDHHQPDYPIVIFHDDFTSEDENNVRLALERVRGSQKNREMPITFARIRLAFPASMTVERQKEVPERVLECSPKSR